MGFGGGKTKTVYVPAPQAQDNSSSQEAKRRRKEKHMLEQSYGQALQTAKQYMPGYNMVEGGDETLSSSSLLNLSGNLGG